MALQAQVTTQGRGQQSTHWLARLRLQTENEQVGSVACESTGGDAFRFLCILHSSGEQTNKSRLWFLRGSGCLFGWNRSNSGWSEWVHACMRVCVCMCVCVCDVSAWRGETRRGGMRESGVLSSAALCDWGLSFTVCSCHIKQTMSKTATLNGKPHFPPHHNYRWWLQDTENHRRRFIHTVLHFHKRLKRT